MTCAVKLVCAPEQTISLEYFLLLLFLLLFYVCSQIQIIITIAYDVVCDIISMAVVVAVGLRMPRPQMKQRVHTHNRMRNGCSEIGSTKWKIIIIIMDANEITDNILFGWLEWCG